jgi:hypothetical protein
MKELTMCAWITIPWTTIPWITITALLVTFSATAVPARAEMWCVRDFGASQRTCVFPSAHDCFRAVSIVGGICERQPVGQERHKDDASPRRQRRSAPDR